jgi:translation initiation factor 4E
MTDNTITIMTKKDDNNSGTDIFISSEITPTSLKSSGLYLPTRPVEFKKTYKESIEEPFYDTLKLSNTYNLYYHLPNDKSWDISSYKIIKSFSTIEELVSLNENLPKNIIKYCMLFIMKDGIAPMWEDPQNQNGGCFSYKVYNKYIVEIWKQMVYAFCGESLMKNKENMKYVNGLTISPKKNFCILKIWIKNMKLQNPEEVISIENLSKMGVLFKAHTGDSG